MGRKLAGLIGIITAALVFGLVPGAQAGQDKVEHSVMHVMAEGKGPTTVGQ
ncbi:hypothetical protein [Streptomyces griseorubiginosus]|uniref:Uncharacterized protein n=1 Tax=Streptomyces griseorubiginosus TaxID=67304 RepID=A0AAI8L5J7_9ACTN|nr:hypothetical protein [Streptomyces griseorubiginosus]AYC41740.1 hypothetical protein DWG14_06031 [Streptomyces griseorubiginosus]